MRATGWVGDADPLHAIADALAVFPADELLVVTPAERRAHWLARDLARRAGRAVRAARRARRARRARQPRGTRAPVAFCTFGAPALR